MITNLIDAEIILNNKKIHLVNTEIDILLSWDLFIIKNDKKAELKMSILEIKGNFNLSETHDNYKKKINIYFNSDDTWNFDVKLDGLINDEIYPTYGQINLDTKSVFIKF